MSYGNQAHIYEKTEVSSKYLASNKDFYFFEYLETVILNFIVMLSAIAK